MTTPDGKRSPRAAGEGAGLELNTRHYNRPGLPALDYRLANHGRFLRRMLARISSQEITGEDGNRSRPLRALTARGSDDPAIALLDGWAMVADVLTFYQERIANEGFLRTAVERRSVLELVRSLTYELKPGVAAGAYLAFTVEEAPGAPGSARVPVGVQILAIPGQDEKPQDFETVEEFKARAEWNLLKPLPHTYEGEIKSGCREIYLKGVTTALSPGDPLLLVGKGPESPSSGGYWELCTVRRAVTDPLAGHTRVTLEEPLGPQPPEEPELFAPRLRTGLFGHNAPQWSGLSPEVKGRFFEEDKSVRCVAVSPDGRRAVSGGGDHTLRLWDLQTGEQAGVMRGHQGPVNSLSICRPGEGATPTAVAGVVDPNALLALAGGEEGSMKLWEVNSGEVVFSAPTWSYPVRCVALSPDYKRALRGGEEGIIELWNLATGELIRSFKGHGGAVNGLAFSPDGTQVASGGGGSGVGGGVVNIWRSAGIEDSSIIDLKPVKIFEGHGLEVTAVAFSPDGAWLLSGGAEGSAKLWKLAGAAPTGAEPYMTLSAHTRAVTCVAFSPEGQWVFTGSADNTIKLWHSDKTKLLNPPLIQELCTFYGHTGPVSGLGLPPGGFPLLSAGLDGALRLWQREEFMGREIRTLSGHGFLDQLGEWPDFSIREGRLSLESEYRGIFRDSWLVLLERQKKRLYRITQVSHEPRSGYTLSGKVTNLLVEPGDSPGGLGMEEFSLRESTVLANAEQLEPIRVMKPDPRPIEGGVIVLERFVPALFTGQALIFSGKRMQALVAGQGAELALTSRDGTEQVKIKAGDLLEVLSRSETGEEGAIQWRLTDRNGFSGLVTASEAEIVPHPASEKSQPVSEVAFIKAIGNEQEATTLFLRTPLNNIYDRSTVEINANVVRATHGKSVREVLGSGDGTKRNQRFTLLEPPLTYLPAPTPTGGESSLAVRVNGALWEETDSLFGLESGEEKYIVRIDNESRASITFGDGIAGARLPTGQENVEALYRTGIGGVGQVAAKSLSLLKTKPLGIRAVTNPLPAGGAADPESMAEAREKAPLTVLTMKRIVSRRDFEDFVRGFAGVGKAQAVELGDGGKRLLHLTVAAHNGGEVAPGSALHLALAGAIDQVREPLRKMRIDSFRLLQFQLEASMLIDPRYEFGPVRSKVEQALRAAFAFDRRSFGQSVTASEVISVIQSVPEVISTDLDLLRLYARDEPANPAGTAASAAVPTGLADGAGSGGGSGESAGLTARLTAVTAHWRGGLIQPAELLLLHPQGVELWERSS